MKSEEKLEERFAADVKVNAKSLYRYVMIKSKTTEVVSRIK